MAERTAQGKELFQTAVRDGTKLKETMPGQRDWETGGEKGPADAALLAQNGWKCPRCGRVNPSHTGSCGCGTTRRESELGLAVPEGMDLEFAAAQRIQACKDLLDAGAITQEEFDQKKARLLRLSQNQTSLCGKDKIIMKGT